MMQHGLFARILDTLFFGLCTALELLAGAFIIALVIGIVLSAIHLVSTRMVRFAVRLYVEIFRAVPVLTQLFIIYFGLPSIGLKMGSISAGILGLGLNASAYATELFRAGLNAVPRGQTEAAQAVGLRRTQTLRHVVIPQAIGVVLPPLTGLAIQVLKNTAVASAVAAPEIMFHARMLVAETYRSPQIYSTVCLFYLVVTLPLMMLARWIERANPQASHT
jgi:His/Glu/Gln/Arg/opine family amino acid ABC transporter permease subunit